MRKIRPFMVALLWPVLLAAATPRLRTYNEFADFSRCRLENISVLAQGSFTLGSRTERVLDGGDPYIWSMVADQKGQLYVGTGNDGRIYRVSAKGDSTLFFDAPELEVYALAMDREDRLYAATSPKGRVYRIDRSGHAEVFFAPNAGYIWALAWDAEHRLLVATGDPAAIYRLDSDGRAEQIFSSSQTHIRCLAVDGRNVIYAGSSGKGCVYRLAPGLSPFLLFDAQLEEVSSLALFSNGTLLAAAYGVPAGGRPAAGPTTVRPRPTTSTAEAGESSSAEVSLGTMSLAIESRLAPEGETFLFRIDSEGYGKNIWSQNEDQVQVLAADDDNNVLVGTGRKGNLYRVLENGQTSLLLSTNTGQISALARAGRLRRAIATSNPGLCFVMDDGSSAKGSLESEPIDAGMISSWGTLSWQGQAGQGTVQFFTRSGNAENPAHSWSDWQPLRLDSGILRIDSPASRFVQFRCDLSGAGPQKPVVEEISLSYIQTNRPPEILAVMVYPQNEYYPVETSSDKTEKNGLVYAIPLGKSEKKKGWRTAHWLFEDANLDGLRFSLLYRREGEKNWRPLATEIYSNIYSWDSSLMADGPYRIKVTATDLPTVPENLALSAEKESDVFIIDDTGPKIVFMPLGSRRQITCQIEDAANRIDSIEYSLNAQGWQKIYPLDGLCDAKQEQVGIPIPRDGKEVEIAVRATDAAGNTQVEYKTVQVSQ